LMKPGVCEVGGEPPHLNRLTRALEDVTAGAHTHPTHILMKEDTQRRHALGKHFIRLASVLGLRLNGLARIECHCCLTSLQAASYRDVGYSGNTTRRKRDSAPDQDEAKREAQICPDPPSGAEPMGARTDSVGDIADTPGPWYNRTRFSRMKSIVPERENLDRN